MLTEILLIPTAAGALAFTGLKLRKQHQYRRLQVGYKRASATSSPDTAPF